MEKSQPKNQLQESFSIKSICKSKIQSIFFTLRDSNPNVPYYLLVLDEISLKIVSSCLKMMELMETGITAIEKLELTRKRFPNMHAIYLLSPCSKSVELLLKDFPFANPQYAKAHLFFTNRVPKDLMKKIAENQDLLSRVKTFKEINQDFLCLEDNLFSVELHDAVARLFSGPNDLKKENYIDVLASKLGTMLISLDKFHEFEILYNPKNEIIAKAAKNLQSFLLFQLQQLEKANSQSLDPKSGKVVVLLFDRPFDPLSPLIHDFFYQSMIYDLLNIKSDLIEYKDEDKSGVKSVKKAMLTDNDALFKRYRYKHIAEALDGIPNEFQNFINQNTTAKLQQGIISNIDLQKMGEIIKTMPQYNELLSKYTMHMKLIEESWAIFEKKDLKELGEVEQSLATGISREGTSVKDSKLLFSINNFLLSESLTSEDKLRLILIAMLTIEIPEKERSKMLEVLSSEDKAVIPKLTWFNYKSDRINAKNKKVKEEIKKLAKSKLSSATLDLCRYTPKIEQIMDEILDNMKKGKMIDDIRSCELASIKINEKLGGGGIGAGPKSLKNKKLGMKIAGLEDESSLLNCPKFVVFGVGGIGYNEIRSLMDLANNQSDDVVFCIGGTSIMKPSDYIQGLREMESLF